MRIQSTAYYVSPEGLRNSKSGDLIAPRGRHLRLIQEHIQRMLPGRAITLVAEVFDSVMGSGDAVLGITTGNFHQAVIHTRAGADEYFVVLETGELR